ncbi:hypothetical protein GCM10010191_00380 [Actinomadura vinacea]|uniref:Uncharacterized protein n=2 Tax=Actinomadura vinacea TaxID=115336 RepID=A0ABN3I8I9_9ACTN
MRLRSTRDLCISVLERDLGHGLHLDRHEQAGHDVWGLVDACLDSPGGIHMLLEAVETFHRGSRSVRALRALVEELLPEPLLAGGERQELNQLVQALERQGLSPFQTAALPLLYQHAVGPVGPPLGLEVRGVRDIIEQLEEMPLRTDGVAPLLVFVNHLAGYARGATATAFGEWTIRFAERSGLSAERLRRLPRILEPAAPSLDPESDAYLVIECRPDGADPDRFEVTAWLQPAGRPAVMLHCDEEPLPPARLPALVEALLARDGRVVARENPELTIEFVLPRELLDQPFDQFKITIAGVRRRLGVEYPVVLRSMDRLRGGAPWHSWRAKWRRLRADPAGATVHRIAEPGGYDDELLFTLLSEPSSVGLAMAFPPGRGGTGRVDELWVGLQAGMPVAVWCRDGGASGRFADEVRALLESDLPSLPRKVRELRREAVLAQGAQVRAEAMAGQEAVAVGAGAVPGAGVEVRRTEEHVGSHLALLYDDADRFPEVYEPLRPPA